MTGDRESAIELIERLVDRVQQIAVIRPGDAVVFSVDDDAGREEIEEMADAVQTWFAEHAPGVNTLLITGAQDVFVARTADRYAAATEEGQP